MIKRLLDILQPSDAAVQQARQRAEDIGGSVVDQLLATGVVTETNLISALSEVTGLQGADPDDYTAIDRDAFETLDEPVVREHRMVPFQKHRRSLAVFVDEPLADDAADDIADAYGVSLTQFVWPTIRSLEAMHVLLDDPLDAWMHAYVSESNYHVHFADDAPDQPRLEAFGVQWSRAQTLDYLQRCYDRDALLYTLMGFASRWMTNRMLLILGHERVTPYLVSGWPELADQYTDLDVLRRVRADVPAGASIFDESRTGYSLADMPEDIGLGQLFVELELFPPDQLLVQTVRLGPRPSMAIIGEPSREALPDVGPLEEVARAVGGQLEEMVRLAKSRQLPPSAERIPSPPEPDTKAPPRPADRDDQPADEPAVPGIANATSSSTQQLDDKPGATAFGIPFADQRDDAAESADHQQRSAVEVGSPKMDEDTNVSIMRPVDVEDDDDDSPADASQPPDDGVQDPTSATMSGGFSVVEFEGGLGDDSNDDSGRSSASSPSAGRDASTAPMAQILRPLSLKEGRQSTPPSDAEQSADVEHSADTDSPNVSETMGRAVNPEATELGYQQPIGLQELSSSFAEELEDIVDLLDSRKPATAFGAAERIAEFGKPAMSLLEQRFPGRLMVDRYQYTIDTLPPVAKHGPVLAALAGGGPLAVPVAQSFLGHTSVELRFYATFLFTQIPVDGVVGAFVPRLFDRDRQTRKIARRIVLDSRHRDWFDDSVRPVLYEAVEDGDEELRVEVAADLLGALRDPDCVPLLIDSLENHQGRVQSRIHDALKAITYKDFVPSAAEWKNWWADAQQQTRSNWLVAALNSNSSDIRHMVFRELNQLEELDLNYHPDQPPKLRGRAQEQLRSWIQRS